MSDEQPEARRAAAAAKKGLREMAQLCGALKVLLEISNPDHADMRAREEVATDLRDRLSAALTPIDCEDFTDEERQLAHRLKDVICEEPDITGKVTVHALLMLLAGTYICADEDCEAHRLFTLEELLGLVRSVVTGRDLAIQVRSAESTH